jgi:hypothetical protein
VYASASRPAPSVRIIQELAMRLRIGIEMPPPIDPENVASTSVAPDITNQVLTSWASDCAGPVCSTTYATTREALERSGNARGNAQWK